ncbi:outer membrane protein TolC [Oceanihabitans sediminis]|uniref:TolC family protein n=1 Tax=Oceanihabitans sediminis TaxID=1812012 RepID=A0A368P5H3_9FLAO|nr:TolC family protein [Oceanihabitans sediminis]RBP32951.1 outer membrane protein TolC [Oceanihabitans sediminis]RCU57530.1 TolC family protein [Oceanihabitans sediminis]
MKNIKSYIKVVLISLSFFFVLKGNSQDLGVLINEALENNPEIQKIDFQHKIASEKVNEVNSIPNTEFNFGFMAVSPEMNMPMERFRVSVMQMLPWFGTITARENYASSMADAQYIEITIAKRKLALSVSQLYYQLYEIDAKQKVLEKNISLLQSYEQIALTSLEVGKASAVDVLKLQIRQNELQEQKEVLTQKSEGLQAALNSLLNRDYDSKVSVLSTLEIPQDDSYYSYDSLQVNPELLKYDKLYESVNQSELLNKKEGGPMIGFGVEYINQENSPMITSSYKDMVMPMVSVSIPIFNKKYKSQTIQNDLRKQEIQSQKAERLNMLKSELAKAISQRNQSRISFDTQVQNLKRAEDAEEILIKNYETGTIDFNDVLDIQELQLKFQMNQMESVKNYFVQSAFINYVTN